MKKLTFVLLLLNLAFFGSSQKKSDWEKTFPSKINWYFISDAGVTLVATKDALYGISPEGKELWKAEDIENIQESNINPLEGTPYILLAKQKMFKTQNNAVDVVTGQRIFNSEELGFYNVVRTSYLPKSNALFMYGGSKTGKYITALIDMATGKKIWEQEKLLEKNSEQIVSDAKEIGGAIFLATNKNIYKLNKSTGDILFSADMKSDLPVLGQAEESDATKGLQAGNKASGLLGKVGGGLLRGAMGASAANDAGKSFGKGVQARQTAISADFFEAPNVTDKVYFWNQDNLTAFDVNTGKEMWTRYKLPSPVGYILHDKNGMIVTTKEKRQEDIAKAGNKGLMGRISRGKDRASLLLLDPATGAEKWNSDVDLKGDILAYRMSGNKFIVGTQQDDGDNYISIVDMDKGASITKKPLSIKGAIQDLQFFPQGLYFRTTDQINILDLETGEKNWKKGFSVKNCLGYNANDKWGLVSANGKIYKVDFVKGDIDVWKENLGFDKDEEPSSISLMDKNIVISSDQNISVFSEDGNQVYHTYVPAPGRTMGGKILSGLGGAAALMAGAAATAQTAQLSYAKGYYGISDPSLDAEINRSSAAAAGMFNASVASFQSINKRFNATKQANGFIAMLTAYGSNQGKDAGITIIDKTTGKRISDMLLGDKKDPNYRIDELGRVIYYQTGGNTLEGFSF